MASLEKNLQKLEEIVEILGRGETGINDSLELYKKGLELAKTCYEQLKGLEKEVKVLVEKNGQLSEEKFNL